MKNNLDYNLVGSVEPAIILLHGWGLNKRYFDRLVPKLHKNQKIISLDFFGFGKSSKPKEYFDTYEYAYHVFLLLKKLNINSIILVGHSFGGRVSIILSSVFDVNVKGVVLTSSAGIDDRNLIVKLKICKYKIAKILCNKKILPKKLLANFGSNDFKNADSGLRQVISYVVRQDLKHLLKLIDAQTILVWDIKDKETKYKICKILQRNIKNSQTVLFATGGHFAYLYNINKFAEIINIFLYNLK